MRVAATLCVESLSYRDDVAQDSGVPRPIGLVQSAPGSHYMTLSMNLTLIAGQITGNVGDEQRSDRECSVIPVCLVLLCGSCWKYTCVF